MENIQFPADALPGSLDHENPMREEDKDPHVDDTKDAPEPEEIENHLEPEYLTNTYPMVVSQDEGVLVDEMGPAPEDLPS